jgi:hypothetical protein
VSVVRVGAGGSLNVEGEPARTGGNGAEAIILARGDRRLYVANFNKGGPGSVTTFAVTRVGDELHRLGGPVPTGGLEPDFGGLAFGPAG